MLIKHKHIDLIILLKIFEQNASLKNSEKIKLSKLIIQFLLQDDIQLE